MIRWWPTLEEKLARSAKPAEVWRNSDGWWRLTHTGEKVVKRVVMEAKMAGRLLMLDDMRASLPEEFRRQRGRLIAAEKLEGK